MSVDSKTLLVAEGLCKTFTKRGSAPIEVLRGVGLEVFPGDRIAILGRSGSGKSTLLHLLGTLESASAGRVLFLGMDLSGFGDKRLSAFRNQELGFVFQFHYLMLEFSALENVMMPALLAGQSRKQARTKAANLLYRVGLAQRMSHRPAELSGGEQQRVAIARALMMSPKLLLTDEMTGNLDAATGSEVFSLLTSLQKETGTALVSVTHDEEMAREYGRVYRLHEGILSPQ